MPRGGLAPRAVDKDAPHCLGRGGKEVPLMVPPISGGCSDQSQIGFMNERGGLQRVAGWLRSQSGGSDNPDSPDVDPALVQTDLQSRPGAARVIYLDFNGGTISGTYWNSEYNDDDPINYADSGMSRARGATPNPRRAPRT